MTDKEWMNIATSIVEAYPGDPSIRAWFRILRKCKKPKQVATLEKLNFIMRQKILEAIHSFTQREYSDELNSEIKALAINLHFIAPDDVSERILGKAIE